MRYIKGISAILTRPELRRWPYIRDRIVNSVSFFRDRNPFLKIDQVVRDNEKFDASYIDRMIDSAIRPYCKKIKVSDVLPNPKRVGYLVSVLGDSVGGHNKLVQNGYKLLSEDYSCKLFLTYLSETEKIAPKLLKEMPNYFGVDAWMYRTGIEEVVKLAQAVVEFNPRFLFVYGQPTDWRIIAVVAMLKHLTKVSVLVAQHTSHRPCIGVSFADVAFHALNSSAYIDFVFRKNTKMINSKAALVCGKKEWYREIPESNRCRQRAELNIPKGYQLTVSGGAIYKFFNPDGTSEYFHMIRDMLERNTKVIHIIRTWGDKKIMQSIEQVMSGSSAADRLRILPPTADFDLFFDAADLYIDSIPIASAMTMVDLMRQKVPYVVFANKENALWTFDEYQRDDYPFVYDNADDMLKGIERLLHDDKLRKSELQANYEYYMKTFDGEICKSFLKNVVEHSDRLYELYSPPPTKSYIFVLDENGNPVSKVLGEV